MSRAPFGIAVIGASAGGLSALDSFFANVPRDSGIAFLVIQHLDPSHKSAMVDILSRSSTIAVSEALDGETVEPDHAYLIPPDTCLAIDGIRLVLEQPMLRDGLRLPIDACLRSLARDRSLPRAGVILSGTGADGTGGVIALKASGGVALAQSQASAEHFEMPASVIATGLVDRICAAEKLPRELLRLFNLPWRDASELHAGEKESDSDTRSVGEPVGEPVGKPSGDLESEPDLLEPQTLDRILQRVKAVSGDDFTFNKEGTLSRRIQRRISLNQLTLLEDYVALVESSDDEARRLRDDLLIGVTAFFRGTKDFKRLETTVIAPLVARVSSDETIRIWIAGCATGQEAYSVAMLLLEQLEVQNRHTTVRIFASDMNEQALAVARAGSYAASIRDEVSAARLRRFFNREGEHYVANSALKDCVTFTRQSLVVEPPFSRLDLICCRNLLIYLQPEVQHRTIALFHFALRQQGCLFLGHAESIGKHAGLFTPIDRDACLFRRTNSAVDYTAAFPDNVPSHYSVNPLNPSLQTRTRASRISERVRHYLLDQYAPAAIVVDKPGQIVHFSGPTGTYLNQPSGTPTRSLMALARPELRAVLRTSLQRLATSDSDGVVTSRPVVLDADSPAVWVVARHISVSPGNDPLVLVIFEPLPSAAHQETGAALLAPVGDLEPSADDGRLQLLEMELKATQDELAIVTENHDWSIEDLKAANEEIRSVNEEFQSTNEELETSKEELQSMNEELSMVNAQLRENVIELKAANDDLNNLLSSTDIATLFLDTSLCVGRYTAATHALFALIPADIGRPLFDIRQKFDDTALYEDARQVLVTSVAREAEVEATDRRVYLRRILPYFRDDAGVDGIVITFVDITARKTLDTQVSRLAAIARDSADAITVINLEGWFIEWNQGAEHLFGWSENQARSKTIQEITPGEAMPPMQTMLDNVKSGLTRTTSFESIRCTRSGEQLEVWLTATALVDDDGQPCAVALTERDITSIRQTESRLREADVRKNEFMAMIAHELRNPLAAMASSIEIMQLCHDDPRALEHAMEVVDRQFDKLTRLTDDLLDVSRISRGHVTLRKAAVDLSDAIRSAIDEIQPAISSAGHELTIDLDARLAPVLGDADRLSQVFSNLLFNAVKYTPDGGRIILRASCHADSNRIEIIDSGIGLDSDAIERIFDMFEQAGRTSRTGYHGLGIGLSLSRWLVESHGGTLEAFSDGIGLGSTFVVTLPRSDTSEVKTGAPYTGDGHSSDTRTDGAHASHSDTEARETAARAPGTHRAR